jgi:hypothetical protein
MTLTTQYGWHEGILRGFVTDWLPGGCDYSDKDNAWLGTEQVGGLVTAPIV